MSPLEPLSVANTKNGHSSPCHATLSSCTGPPQSLPPNSCNHDRKKNLKLPRHRQGVKAGSRQSKREIRTLTNALTISMGLPHLLSGKLGYGQAPQPQAPTRLTVFVLFRNTSQPVAPFYASGSQHPVAGVSTRATLLVIVSSFVLTIGIGLAHRWQGGERESQDPCSPRLAAHPPDLPASGIAKWHMPILRI